MKGEHTPFDNAFGRFEQGFQNSICMVDGRFTLTGVLHEGRQTQKRK
jgi:hypothetical protein